MIGKVFGAAVAISGLILILGADLPRLLEQIIGALLLIQAIVDYAMDKMGSL
jgi:hypothetical protein